MNNTNEPIGSNKAQQKTAREAQQRQAEKRSNLLYGVIAVIFVLCAAATLVWRSNVIPRSATAVTINGEKYTASEVAFYYQNVYQSFLSDYSYVISYLGLNTNASLKGQTIDETAAPMLGVEPGSSWHEFFLNQALDQMATLQATLEQADADGFVNPESVQIQYDDSVKALHEAATASALSVDRYLQANIGSLMTEKIYNAQILRLLRYSAYVSAYQDGLTYTDAQLEEAYKASPDSYDRVSYEVVTISGSVPETTDADGNPVEPDEAEVAAAKADAEALARSILADFKSGKSLETLAEGYDNATYSNLTAAANSSSTVSEWAFASSRRSGDTAVLDSDTTFYVVVFHDRFREDYATIDVRHILIPPQTTTLTSEDEGYDEEVERLMAEAKAKADDILAQWKAGEATEESFAALAAEHSADGSKYTGGLYTEVFEGQMVPTFNDWCFDAARQSGDTDVVETNYGAHVMYFVGRDLSRWQSLVAADLRGEDSSAWFQTMAGKYTAQPESFGLKFVG